MREATCELRLNILGLPSWLQLKVDSSPAHPDAADELPWAFHWALSQLQRFGEANYTHSDDVWVPFCWTKNECGKNNMKLFYFFVCWRQWMGAELCGDPPGAGMRGEQQFVVELREKKVQMLTGLSRSREHSATLSRVLVVFFSSHHHIFSRSLFLSSIDQQQLSVDILFCQLFSDFHRDIWVKLKQKSLWMQLY